MTQRFLKASLFTVIVVAYAGLAFAESDMRGDGLPQRQKLFQPLLTRDDFSALWLDPELAVSGFFNDRLQLRIGGYFMSDWGSAEQRGELDGISSAPGAGVEMRDTQIDIRGAVSRALEFRLQLNVDNQALELQESYIRRAGIPYLGSIRIGHFKEPFGLEHTGSIRYAPFLERSIVDGILPARGVGLEFSNSILGDRLRWAAGAFYGTDSVDTINESGSFSLTGRITGLALYREDRDELLHFGASFSHRSLRQPIRYKVRPEVNLAPRYLDTGDFNSDSLDVFGLEAAYMRGPLLAQMETVWSTTSEAVRVDSVTLGEIVGEATGRVPRLADWLGGKTNGIRPPDSTFWDIPFSLAARGELQFFGAYAQLGYILTGEHRQYDVVRGVFGQVVPSKPLRRGGGGGWGAWEVAGRVSHLDINDDYVHGGRETNVSLGLNWYPARSFRFATNYVHGDVSRGDLEGDFNALVLRFQVDVAPKSLDSYKPASTRSE